MSPLERWILAVLLRWKPSFESSANGEPRRFWPPTWTSKESRYASYGCICTPDESHRPERDSCRASSRPRTRPYQGHADRMAHSCAAQCAGDLRLWDAPYLLLCARPRHATVAAQCRSLFVVRVAISPVECLL